MDSLAPNFSAGSVKENMERLAWTPRLRVHQGQGSGDEACWGWLRSRASRDHVCQPSRCLSWEKEPQKALHARPLALPASHRMGLPSCRSLTPSRAARQPLQGAFRREAIFGAGVLGSCSHEKPSHVCPQSYGMESCLAGLVSKRPVLLGEQTSNQLGSSWALQTNAFFLH